MPAHSRTPQRVFVIRRIAVLAILLVVVTLGAWGATRALDGDRTVAVATPTREVPAPTAEPSPTPVEEVETGPVTFTLVTAGDVLPHATVNRTAQTADGGYDYVPMMEPVRDWIEGADIALCSLEVPLAPAGEAPSAYPVFGAPEELITSLQSVGWDGCATATNHSLDRGIRGLERTLAVMDDVGIGHTGTGRTPAETVSAQFYEVERDGASFTLAHLSATTFHNDYTEPSQYAASLHALEADAIVSLAREARGAGADIVLFTPHWGQEYWHEPDGLQQDIAATLAVSGEVDVVLGGHAHVPQPLIRLDGGVDGAGMWVGYSMGNFLSNQDEKCCTIATSTAMIPRVEITVTGEDVAVTDVTWSGAMIDTDGGQRLYPIQALLDGERPEGITLSEGRIQDRWAAMTSVLGLEKYDPEPPRGGASVTVIPRSP